MGSTPLRLALSAFFAFTSALAGSVAAAQPLATTPERVTQLAAVTTGTITGQVLDEQGKPLSDVVVSAVGGSTSFAVTDRTGQFVLTPLVPGPYLVRAHLDGYVAARHTMVTVRPASSAVSSFTLRRAGDTETPPVVAAGAAAVDDLPAASGERSEGEVAWRLRRLKRSILKDSGPLGLPADDEWFIAESLQLIGRAVESSARMAGSLFAAAPLQGQVNLLTTGAFDSPGEILQLDRTRAVAFFAVGAPVGHHGDWSVKAALNQGDLSAWLVAGNYATRAPARHQYQFGMSYGVHRYEGGNAAALAAMAETARNVGALYAYDQWRVGKHLSLGYGGHYARYDYLVQPAHFSPRASATLHVTDRTNVRAVAAHRVTAPGAEEFLPPSRAEVLPPQRTFAPLTRDGFTAEELRHYELAVERVLDGATIGVRAFQQSVDHQLVTIFGLRDDARPSELGHYYVGSAGDLAVRGWGLSVSHAVIANVRGTFDYSVSDAAWANPRSLDRARLAQTMPAALREARERVHDFTTSLETELPQSATRVYVLYKINSGYIRTEGVDGRPGFDGRWDVQVNQRLPFLSFTSADWEMLVAVRNLFRESFAETSVYDELLVARPPKRLVGGITVKF